MSRSICARKLHVHVPGARSNRHDGFLGECYKENHATRIPCTCMSADRREQAERAAQITSRTARSARLEVQMCSPCLLSFCLGPATGTLISPASAAEQVRIGSRPHHQRCRLLRGRRHGLLPRRRAWRCPSFRLQFGGADDRAARHWRARRRRRHGLGRLLQRGRARHSHEDRGRSGLDQAGLRLFLADGAQGPRRERALQDLRRPQGHEGSDRRAGHRHAPRRSTRR